MRSEAIPSGARIGPFLVHRLAGRGASGEVYLALDERSGQPVALKLLHAEAADVTEADRGASAAETARRFEAEAATMRALRHPDIASVFGCGQARGRPWVAMEWLPGHDLSRYTAPARLLPEALAVQIAERLALALHHAHGQGVVHRDVKPGNVRVDLAARRVKLADFGIARADGATQTRTGVVLGSPAYMAPEQLAGAEADARGDVYSLGVVLFELLAGRLPHDSTSLGELLRQVAHEPAPDLRDLRPELPPELAAVVARALAKQPTDRPADAAGLAAGLARARLHIPGGAG